MQKILEITRAKTVNTEKVVKNIGLKLQKILEIVQPKTVNTEKIVKDIGLTSVSTRKYQDIVKGILNILTMILENIRKKTRFWYVR